MNSEEQAFATRFIGFADCAVDRIVPRALFNDVLDVAAEEYYEWDIESTNWKGKRPQISDANFVKDLSPYIERKLFTLNSGHAICAYLGFLHGHETVLQSISDRAISDIVYQAMQESGNGLIQKFALDETKHHAYIDRIVARFQNPYLEDSVLRVGRDPIRKLSADERLIKPLMTAVSYGCGVDHLFVWSCSSFTFCEFRRFTECKTPTNAAVERSNAHTLRILWINTREPADTANHRYLSCLEYLDCLLQVQYFFAAYLERSNFAAAYFKANLITRCISVRKVI